MIDAQSSAAGRLARDARDLDLIQYPCTAVREVLTKWAAARANYLGRHRPQDCTAWRGAGTVDLGRRLLAPGGTAQYAFI